MKAVLDPEVKLPEFFAVNLTRLPAVNVPRCDVTVKIAECFNAGKSASCCPAERENFPATFNADC